MKELFIELRLLFCDWLLNLILWICPKNEEGLILIININMYYRDVIKYRNIK